MVQVHDGGIRAPDALMHAGDVVEGDPLTFQVANLPPGGERPRKVRERGVGATEGVVGNADVVQRVALLLAVLQCHRDPQRLTVVRNC